MIQRKDSVRTKLKDSGPNLFYCIHRLMSKEKLFHGIRTGTNPCFRNTARSFPNVQI